MITKLAVLDSLCLSHPQPWTSPSVCCNLACPRNIQLELNSYILMLQ